MFKNILSFNETGYIFKLAAKLDIPEFYLIKQVINLAKPELLDYAFVALFIVLLLICAFIISRKNALQIVTQQKTLSGKFALAITFLFIWCVISFSQVSTFIYFNF